MLHRGANQAAQPVHRRTFSHAEERLDCLRCRPLGIIATQAAAQEFISQYTSADTRKCRKVERVKVDDTEYAAAWACKALAGYLVVVSEEDLRTTVAVGKSVTAAAREPAASQAFGPFNFTYDTVEWRSVKGAALPFALIQRWNISDGENPGKDGWPGRNALLIVTP
jgi:hypothetical protein